MHKKENLFLGALYILLAATSFSCMSVLIKYIAPYVTDDVIVFFRNLIGLVLLLPFLFIPKQKPLATQFFPNHFVRAIASVLTLYCLFYSIHHILLADAILLNNTMPLFVPFVMYVWKGEKIPRGIILPLIISFAGVILILHPGKNIINIASLVALLSGLLMAIATVGVRLLGKNEPSYRIMFYTLGIGTLVSSFPLFWRWHTPSVEELLILLGIGFFGILYQFCITKGYQLAHPTKVSPLIYIAVIISGLFDWLLWNQIPTLISYAGLVLVVVGAF